MGLHRRKINQLHAANNEQQAKQSSLLPGNDASASNVGSKLKPYFHVLRTVVMVYMFWLGLRLLFRHAAHPPPATLHVEL
jgi:hypothetical protein